MRIISLLSFLLMTSVLAFSQSAPVNIKLPANTSISDPLVNRAAICGFIPAQPVTDTTVIITGNCWGAKVKPTDTVATIRFHCAAIKLSTEPLYIIDGWPMESSDLKAIDPNNIERVDILKDAAATTIFGIRANAGVVIITTKRKREFEIVDMQDGTKIPGATIQFKAVGKNHDRLSLAADHTGSIITDKLTSHNYEIEVSAIGYKTTTLSWCRDSLHKKTIFLDRLKKIPATIKTAAPVEKSMPAIKIFPNPLTKGQSFTIGLKNILPDEIIGKILGADGRQLMTRSFITEGNQTLKMETDARWPAGTYFIQLTTPGGEIIRTQQVIIH